MSTEEYIKVSLLDVIRTSQLAKQNNEDPKLIEKLVELFVTAENELEFKLLVDSDEAKCILKYNKGAKLQNYITLESLGLALNKLYIGKSNKELLKRIEKYYRTFLENITKEEDNTELKQQIITDNEAFELIKQHSSYDIYEKDIIGKKAKRKILINKQEVPIVKNKAIID